MVVATADPGSTRRLRTPSGVDGAVAAALALISVVEALVFDDATIEVVAGALAPLPLAWRRVYALPACLLPAPVYWSQLLFGQPADEVVMPLVVVGLCSYSLAAYAGRWRWAGLVVLAIQVAGLVAGNPLSIRAEDAAFGAVPVLGPFAIGLVSGSRSLRAVSAEERAAELERSAAAERRAAVAAERLRIARDLHDLLAHSVSVMVVQAGAAQQVLGSDPERARDALTTVQETGRRALEETGALVGLLREGGEDVEMSPAPRLADIGALVEDLGRAGLAATVTVEGEARPLSQGTDLSAYRVVQEALSNVLQHSTARAARVALRWSEAELRISVVDDGPAASPGGRTGGHGLLGMRERMALVGGSVDAGAEGEGFAVRAWLPLTS